MIENETHSETEALQVVFEVPDHDALTELMTAINNIDTSVRTEAITAAQMSEETTAKIDLDILTEKQRQTLSLAVRRGYYERPRKTDLSELASHLDISKSAVSQRLRTAEMKLIKTALERYS